MLRNTEDLIGFALRATDGEIGNIKDMYFDDDAWTIRYLVVDAGTWLSSRKVLVSPLSAQMPDWHGKTMPVNITQEQVRNSPNIDTDKPVSRQNETQYLSYYGYPNYWGGQGLWGDGMYPYTVLPSAATNQLEWAERMRQDEAELAAERTRHRNDDPHLRSCEAIKSYQVKATDGDIGHVDGYLVDEMTWAIRYLVVNTSNWWMGHQVLVAPPWITAVQWSNETVSLDLSRDAVKASPPYNAKVLMDRQWEDALHQHYGRTGYWAHAEEVQL